MRSPADEPLPPDTDSIRRLKAALRREAIAVREGTRASLRADWSAAVRARISRLPRWGDARLVALFAAIRGEVDLLPLVPEALARGKHVLFPRVDPTGGTISFHRVASPGELAPGAFGVPEPPGDGGSRVDLGDIDLLLVPGVAFDARGGRLGFGGGYYDRLLESRPAGQRDPRPFLVGVAFECQVVARVPTEPTDRQVDALVTEARWVSCEETGDRDRMP